MKFTVYIPKGAVLPVRYYSVDKKNLSIGYAGGHITVITDDPDLRDQAESFLARKGVDIGVYADNESKKTLLQQMKDADIIQQKGVNDSYKPLAPISSYSANAKPKTINDLIKESKELVLKTAPFKVSSIKNLSVVVSSNEVDDLHRLLSLSKLENVTKGHLEVADIEIVDNKTGDVLLVERKTTQDMYQSVIVNHHAHDQSERMFERVQQLRADGKRARAIWVVEGIEGGKTQLDNALPEIRQVSGLVGYLDAINDQSVLQSYSIRHTAYLVLKFAQAFFEQKLANTVKTKNPMVNRSGKARLEAKANSAPIAQRESSGVVRHTATDLASMLSYIPSVNTKVAQNLAATGKSFAEILQMPLSEIMEIEGVGKKTAEQILNAFNMRG
jgi:ERCC4-type nuclease